MSGVQIRGLSKSYTRGTKIIDDLDLEVEEGEFVTLLGPSGCGKTTTLRCIAGLETPDSGEIRIGGKAVNSESGKTVPTERRRIGLVFQNYALWPHMTVEANVAYPLKLRRVPAPERRAQVQAALDSVGLSAQAKRPSTMLSGGQQQRVALARALVGAPTALLYDEPLSNLDAQLRVAMRREIRRAHDAAGVASILVTHDQEEATVLSDRVLLMRGGKIEQSGEPRMIFRHPRTRFVAEFFGYENFLSGRVIRATGGVVEVRLDSGELVHSESALTPAIGAQVELAIRPRDVRITPEAPGERPNCLPARLVGFAFAGDELDYDTKLGDRTIRILRSDDDLEHPLLRTPGPADEPCYLELPPSRLVVLEPDSPDSPDTPDTPDPRKEQGR